MSSEDPLAAVANLAKDLSGFDTFAYIKLCDDSSDSTTASTTDDSSVQETVATDDTTQ